MWLLEPLKCPLPCSVSASPTHLRGAAPFGLALASPMAGPSRHRPEASMFSGSANPSFRDSEFKAAGHDFFNSPTFNVHFTAPFSEISTNQGKHEHRAPAGDLDRPRIVAPFKQFKWLLGFLTHHPQPLPVEGSPRPVSREVSDPSPVTVNNPLPSPELESSKHLPSQKKRKRTSSLGPPPSSKRHKPDDLRPYINVVSCSQITERACSYLS
jgi:hypothetical protein